MRLIESLLAHLELELVPGLTFSKTQAGPFEPGAGIWAGTCSEPFLDTFLRGVNLQYLSCLQTCVCNPCGSIQALSHMRVCRTDRTYFVGNSSLRKTHSIPLISCALAIRVISNSIHDLRRVSQEVKSLIYAACRQK